MADEAKGNAAFSSGDFNSFIKHFTEAINLAPTNHVLYLNRSASYASLHQYDAALSDAKKTVELKPDWSEGYSRVGAAYLGLHQYQDAISAYKKGLEIDPNDEALKSGLADAQSASASRSRAAPPLSLFCDAFLGPEMWAALAADLITRIFLEKPDFVMAMQEIQKNPIKLNEHLRDLRVLQALGVLLNAKFNAHDGDDDVEIPEADSASTAQPAKEEVKKPAPEPEPEPMEIMEEEKEKKEKKDFETAIQHYTTEIELDDGDISNITNRAAIYLEMGKYEDCIKDCDKAVERGRELKAGYEMIARALTWKGTVLVKMAKCSKDYEAAVETFQKALAEHHNPDTLKKLNDAEKAKEDLEQREYLASFDPKYFDRNLATEARMKGNEFYKQHKYPEAVEHYTESMRRDPIYPATHINRSLCYLKLGKLSEGLKDAGMCVRLDSSFARGYELLNCVQRCMQQRIPKVGLCDDKLKEKQAIFKKFEAMAMQDPEIPKIIFDPIMRQVFNDFRKNPRAAQEHLKDPTVVNKIQKLIDAGLVKKTPGIFLELLLF
ncbi:Hop3 [Hibiscus trionum]|uniref:Hop3 n=1 Tax=Hibiscus trionum TaxID=183268 RepID=A0A9W7I905_HIBTR|nr:Hop3 [Hibiscus trionum]